MRKLEINNRRFLGSKYKLLNFIEDTVNEHCKDVKSVIDVFAGTGVVGSLFLKNGKEVYFNDYLKSNCYSYKAFYEPTKADIKKLEKIINNYNDIEINEENYFSENFSDTYFSSKDCKKIGYIRDNIEDKFKKQEINEREKCILIASLIYSMDRVANTVGHYDAYRKIKNIEDKFFMYMLDVSEKGEKKSHISNLDANEFIKTVKADLVYIDPPYNSRQYCDAYHLLENVAVWNKPKVYGVAKKMDRTNLKSRYCTNKAVETFDELIRNCNCKYILVSYNNTGDKSNSRSNAKISDLQIKQILEKKGKVQVFEQAFNNFTTGKSVSVDHKERLFLCETAEVCGENQIQLKDNNSFAKSPLNYTGGKFKLLPQFDKIFPKEVDTFVDFFCGGANVAVNSNAKKVIAIDKEINLIRILELFKNYDYMEIVNKLESIIEKYNLSNTYKNGYEFYGEDSSSGLGKYNKQYYLNLRNDYNHMKDSTEKDFMFLTLVIYAFNHQIRFNSNGKYNMPVGKRDFNSSIRKNLLEFCRKIVVKNISFVNTDYKKFELNSLTSNDFCYFDPPYYLGDASYNENDGWNENKEKELLEYLNKVNKHGIKFALSNVTEHKGLKNEILIDWAIENQYNIHNLNYNYSNSNYHLKDKNQITKEVLITNY
jgi:DNA adenine methylase Dam